MSGVVAPEPTSGPTEPEAPAGSPGVRTRLPWRTATLRSALLVALGLGLGALGGVVWWWVTDLPTYLVAEGGGVNTTERGLAQVLGIDAGFAVIGAVVGLGLGVLGWRRLNAVGWPVVLLAAGTAVLAALLCWAVGHELGPGEFTARLAVAQPGQRVPVDLTLQAKASLLVWPFFAVIPVLLASSLGHDEEDPWVPARRRARSAGDDGG